MSISPTVKKQFAEVAAQCGMTELEYATQIGAMMPRATGNEKAKIAAQIYKTGACPLMEHAQIMAHGGAHKLALNYDGWVAAGHRAGITGIECEIIEKQGEPWGVKATVLKGEQSYSRTEVIDECRKAGSRNSKAWRDMPLRMTQHRAIVSAIRCACSINSNAIVDEMADAGFQSSDAMTIPPALQAAEEVFDSKAIVKPAFKGTATITVDGEQGGTND